MARESAYFKEIERLLSVGYEPKHIVKIAGIPKATVYRIVDKLRKEARFDFDNLMTKDYLWKYQQNLENFSKTIQECNEKLVEVKSKYDAIELMIMESIESLEPRQSMTKSSMLANLISCQSSRTNEMIKIVAQRDKATDMKAKVYNAGPVVYAIDNWIKKTNPANGDQPELILEESTPEPEQELSQDDLDVLKELEDES